MNVNGACSRVVRSGLWRAVGVGRVASMIDSAVTAAWSGSDGVGQVGECELDFKLGALK